MHVSVARRVRYVQPSTPSRAAQRITTLVTSDLVPALAVRGTVVAGLLNDVFGILIGSRANAVRTGQLFSTLADVRDYVLLADEATWALAVASILVFASTPARAINCVVRLTLHELRLNRNRHQLIRTAGNVAALAVVDVLDHAVLTELGYVLPIGAAHSASEVIRQTNSGLALKGATLGIRFGLGKTRESREILVLGRTGIAHPATFTPEGEEKGHQQKNVLGAKTPHNFFLLPLI
jgi:hypothetical protein